jgi:oligoendopeptidase F
VPAYLDFLRAGGSASPTDLVAPFDLDLRSTDTWREAFDVLDQFCDEAVTLSSQSQR